jgi:NAD(P)-dependent dehydrogenase (short-subunit alcohol dehydrogenase family)
MTIEVEPNVRVAVVTGAATGIGLASARAFADAGYSVVLVDRDGDRVGAAAREIGGDSLALKCDVSVWEEVRQTFEEVRNVFGRVDALFSNAGASGYFLFEDMEIEEMKTQIDVNLFGHLYCAKAALPLMSGDAPGNIVFTASVQGHLTLPGCVPYAAAKAGLMAVARALAVELGPKGIRVNTVSPGTIDTSMLRKDLASMDDEKVNDFLSTVRAANALGRIGESREIADVVVFLCSNAASYITGQDVVVDGGYLRVKKFGASGFSVGNQR